MELDIDTRKEGNHVVISVGGEVDVITAPSLREAILTELVADNYNLVIDLSRVDFLDSNGLGVLVGTLKRIRENEGKLVLAAVPDRVLKVLTITGLTRAFTITDTVEEALAN